ncbi:MAG: class I SAM-dependent methyltransferase, partial [Myxococcales bacterium]|nr:class I SAM-dependent methyltransferase [Myxococcales bacterium]
SARVQAALADAGRPAEERARDANRKPVETLAFFGIREDMDVLELVPGGGWYSRLLAPALAGTGSLSVWIGVDRFADRFTGLGLEGVEIAAPEAALQSTERRGIFSLPAVDFGQETYDAVLTFRNLHNLTPEARATLNRAVFGALRPGGVYGVVDHTRRHMAPDDAENRRRLDPVVVIHEALAAGFVFEAWSDLHHRLDDELRYEVGRRSVSGNTDRFTLRFRKPQ